MEGNRRQTQRAKIPEFSSPKRGKDKFRKADGKIGVNLNEPNLGNTGNQIPGFLVK